MLAAAVGEESSLLVAKVLKVNFKVHKHTTHTLGCFMKMSAAIQVIIGCRAVRGGGGRFEGGNKVAPP